MTWRPSRANTWVLEEGGLAGFSDMVRSTKGRRFDDGGSSRPSDVLAIRDIRVSSGTVVWTTDDGTTGAVDASCRDQMATWCYQVCDFCKFDHETVAVSRRHRHGQRHAETG